VSLINQVLRDLETRKRREQPVPGELRAVRSRPRNLSRGFFVLAGIILLTVSAYLLWNRQDHQPAAVAKIVAPVPARSMAPARPMPPPAASPAVEPVPAKPADNPPAPATAVTQVQLLDTVASDDSRGFRLRFDHPPTYRLFTLEDPDRIVLDVQDVTAADDFTTRSTLPAGITGTRFSLDVGKRMRVVFDVSPGVHANATLTDATTLMVRFSGAADKASAVTAPVPAAPAAVADAGPGSMRKTLRNRPADLAQDAYNDGLAHLNAGDTAGAEQRFRAALQQMPGFDPAREALARLLSQTGRSAAAEAIITEGIKVARDKPRFARLDAELLVRRGAVADALRVLESALPDIHVMPEHYAFMAALAQRSGDNTRAAKLYQEVLAIRPDDGVWWTGLGISLERLKQVQAALNAYRHASQTGDLNPDVAQFVAQRIKALGP
jgi:Flp pilus assembly protein TadD